MTLTNALEFAKHYMGEEDFALWSSALRRELVLWLRASTAELPEAQRLRLDLVVQQALTSVGLIEMS
jgi:hypothetical protein